MLLWMPEKQTAYADENDLKQVTDNTLQIKH